MDRITNNAHMGTLVLHRGAASTADKGLVMGTITETDMATGELSPGTTYYYSVCPRFRYQGPATPSVAASKELSADKASMKLMFNKPTLKEAAAYGYDIFLSTDSNPKYVGYVTEVQRAAGAIITAMGTVTTEGGQAGSVKVNVVGTGVANNADPFKIDNSYILETDTAKSGYIAPVDLTNAVGALVEVSVEVDDLRANPTLILAPFIGNQLHEYMHMHPSGLQTVTLLSAAGKLFKQSFWLDINGVHGKREDNDLILYQDNSLKILIDTITGQGTEVDIFVAPYYR